MNVSSSRTSGRQSLSEWTGALTLEILDKNPETKTATQKRRVGRFVIGSFSVLSAPLVGVALMSLENRTDLSDPVVDCAVESLDAGATHSEAIVALQDCDVESLPITSPGLDNLAQKVLDRVNDIDPIQQS